MTTFRLVHGLAAIALLAANTTFQPSLQAQQVRVEEKTLSNGMKLLMLVRGQLARPIDWFDLVLHGSPWALALAKAAAAFRPRSPA